MRFPKLPARNQTPEHDEGVAQQPGGPSVGPATDYRDVPMPNVAPPPLTSELTRSIRFTISEPRGYYFEQVESFVEQVIEALTYYEQTEFQWRQTVYEMQIEADQQAYDNQRLRSEIELFKVQGSPMVNPDGSYVTESQQATTEALMADLSAAHEALNEYQAVLADRDAEVARLTDLATAQDQEIVSLRQWGEQVSADMHTLREQVAALSAEAETLRSVVGTTAPVLADGLGEVPPVAVPVVPVSGEVAVPETSEVVEPVAAPEQVSGVPMVTLPVFEEEPEEGDDYEDEDYDDEDGYDVDESEDTLPSAEALPYVEVPTGAPVEVVEFAEPEAEVVDEPSYDGADLSGPATVTDPEAHDEAYGVENDTDTEQAVYTPGGSSPETYPAEAVTEVPTVAFPAADDEQPYVEEPQSDEDEADGEYDEDDADEDDADEYDPYEEFDAEASEEPGESTPVAPVDSELPEGAELPGTGENAITYPPAAPGIPLDTKGVPVEMWAPELDPRLRATIEADQIDTSEAETGPEDDTHAHDEGGPVDLHKQD